MVSIILLWAQSVITVLLCEALWAEVPKLRSLKVFSFWDVSVMGSISPVFFIPSLSGLDASFSSVRHCGSGLIFTMSLCAGPNKRVFWCILEKRELVRVFWGSYVSLNNRAAVQSLPHRSLPCRFKRRIYIVCVEIRPRGNRCQCCGLGLSCGGTARPRTP